MPQPPRNQRPKPRPRRRKAQPAPGLVPTAQATWRGLPAKVLSTYLGDQDRVSVRAGDKTRLPAGRYYKLTAVQALEELWRQTPESFTPEQQAQIQQNLLKQAADAQDVAKKKISGHWYIITPPNHPAAAGDTVDFYSLRRMLPDEYKLLELLDTDLAGRKYWAFEEVL